MAAKFTQDPNEILDYKVDWTAWLPAGDTITASTFTAEEGITVGTPASSFTTTTTTVWVSGGTAGNSYNVVNHVETAESRVGERTLVFQIKQL